MKQENNTKSKTITLAMTIVALGIMLSAPTVLSIAPMVAFATSSQDDDDDKGNDNNNSDNAVVSDNGNNKNDDNNKDKVKDNNDNNNDDNEDDDTAAATNDDDDEANQVGAELTLTDSSGNTVKSAGTPTGSDAKTASATAATTTVAASTDTLVPEFNSIIWTTTRQPGPLLTMTNAIGTGNAAGLDPGDQLIIHAGPSQTPATLQPWADSAKQVTGITDNNICFEVNSLAQIQSFSQAAVDNGFGCIYYDLEPSSPTETHSPDAEVKDPINYFTQAKAVADNAGIELGATPSRAITMSNGTNIAPLVTLYHIQSQALQDDDTACAALKNFVVTWEQNLRSANNALNGKISYQVSASASAATGKSIYVTMQDCVRATSPTPEDGVRAWWNGPFFDGTSPFTATTNLKAFLTFVENGWSVNNPN